MLSRNFTLPRNTLRQVEGLLVNAKVCYKDNHSFYLLREHKWEELGEQIGPGAQNVDLTQLTGDVDDNSQKEELETCKNFLVDGEKENGKQSIYNFAMDTLDPKILLEKLDVEFNILKCATKLNVAFGLCSKTQKTGLVGYYYPHDLIQYWRDLNL